MGSVHFFKESVQFLPNLKDDVGIDRLRFRSDTEDPQKGGGQFENEMVQAIIKKDGINQAPKGCRKQDAGAALSDSKMVLTGTAEIPLTVSRHVVAYLLPKSVSLPTPLRTM
jgi:hypothetical protein